MKDVDVATLQFRIETMLPSLNEYQRRRYLSTEAKSIGYGGITLVSQLSGVSRQTLTDGIKELDLPDPQADNTDAKILGSKRCRKPGGGRKSVLEHTPEILSSLLELLEPHTKGDPMRPLLWTNKSNIALSEGLAKMGHVVSKTTVAKLLKMLGYGLQATKKSLTAKPTHPDRDKQFEHINDEAKKAFANGNPVLSIDAKKKEQIGNYKNNGKTQQPHDTPLEALDHSFIDKILGKATPFGVYNIFQNKGFVNVGLSSDTAVFAVESLRRWWYAEGANEYANADKIVLTADCGGSNGNRTRLWKFELQKLANEIKKDIQVLHFPPGTSKWNKIEHRLFSFISKNWQGISLISAAIIVNLIGATKTHKGLSVKCVLDKGTYETGIKVSDEEFNSINITKDEFHGEWNYTIYCNKY